MQSTDFDQASLNKKNILEKKDDETFFNYDKLVLIKQ